MSKDNNNSSVEMEIKIKSVVRGPEVTKLQRDIANILIQATPDKTKIPDALAAGCLYVAKIVDDCLPEREFFKEAFYAISALAVGLINGQYKETEGGGE